MPKPLVYASVRKAGRALGLLLLLALCPPKARGQVNGEQKLGAWYMYFGTHRVAERWSIHNEAQFRYYDLGGNFNQLLLRAGINYHLRPRTWLTFGYAYIDTDPTFGDPFPQGPDEQGRNIPENRLFEQFIQRHTLGRWALEHRFRLEQRFLTLGDTRRTEHRTRYRLQATYPLSDTFFVNLYDEIFINLQGDPFGQNRLYGALGAHLGPSVSLQAGYLLNSFTAADYHRLQLALFWNADLRKKTNTP